MNILKMTNLGVFNQYLEKEIQAVMEKRKASKDPYEQMGFDSEKRVLEKTLMNYTKLIVNQNK